jgi:hypothetical protein
MENDKREKRKNQIIFLVDNYYNTFEFLHYEPLNLLEERAVNLFLDSDLSIEEINEQLIIAVKERKKAFEQRYDAENVSKNHREIYSKLEKLVNMLNRENIDYYLAGSLCGYLKYGEESDRCHDDIDITLNERDIDKFKKICLNLGLNFSDNRMTSPRVLKNGIPSGEHEVIATSSESDFHIGAFPFERLADGTIISKGYYHDEENNPCAREEIISPELANEIYGGEVTQINGEAVRITAPEYVYSLKSYTKSQKDQHDLEVFSDKINVDKLNRIKSLGKTDSFVQYVSVYNLPPTSIQEENTTVKTNSEIDMMLEDSSNKGLENTDEKKQEVSKEKPKQFVKSNNSNSENGYVDKFTILVTILILIIIFLIGVLILNW